MIGIICGGLLYFVLIHFIIYDYNKSWSAFIYYRAPVCKDPLSFPSGGYRKNFTLGV